MRLSLLMLALLCTIGFTGDQRRRPTAQFTIKTLPSHTSPASFVRCDPRRGTSPQIVQIRNFKNAWQIQRSCSFPDAEYVGFVLDLFYRHWKLEFGDEEGKIFKTLDNIMIEWGTKVKQIQGGAFNVDGKEISGAAKGLTLMPGYIWVWEEKYKRIAATALIHELVHSALWAQSGEHGDPDHEGSDFEGWTPAHTDFIRKINRLLAKLDI